MRTAGGVKVEVSVNCVRVPKRRKQVQTQEAEQIKLSYLICLAGEGQKQGLSNKSQTKARSTEQSDKKRWEDCIRGENRSGRGVTVGGGGAMKTSENLQKLGKLRQQTKKTFP